MKKNYSFSDDAGVVPSSDYGYGPAAPSAAASDTLFVDGGEPYAFAIDAGSSGSVSAGSAKPVAPISQLADYLVNGFWQYNGSIAHHWASSNITYNIAGLNTAEQFLARSAMQAWHDVANVNFVQTSGTANITFTHTGTMEAVTDAAWYSSGAIAYATVNISTDWITTDGGAMDGKTGIDSYGYQTYIHEIGHALGLGHQGPYNGSASYSTNAVYANDTWQYSIMSYFSENNYSGSSYRYVVTPQMADIYAVGSIYGAATTTRAGDTVYGFNSNAGAVFSFSGYSQAPALTIYDSGGNDTLDCSGYSVAQTIDLHAGAFSSIGGLVHNIGIALSATIEKAIGGSGNDTLIASDAGCTLSGGAGNDLLTGGAGSDRLVGGAGIDTIAGGGGADTFVFAFGDSSAASGQHDRITDFATGVDHIDLSAIDAIAATGSYDLFRFIGTSAFSGTAGELDYFYNSALGVTTLQGDTNGDRVADLAIDLVGNLALGLGDFIGANSAPVVIESFGSTKLDQVGSYYYLDGVISSLGPAVKVGGGAIAAGTQGAWNPIGAEQTATGYEVAWKNGSADQYIVWATDSNGNLTSFLSGVVSGASATLKNFEASFHQDLNCDGAITAASAIESFGSTKLDLVGSYYYLDSVSGGSGPAIKVSGAAIAAGAQGAWNPIGAEQTASGYEVAWKNGSVDQYIVWATDSNGNLTSFLSGVVSGASATLQNFEASFHQDLNGDGVITASVAIESFGSTKLYQVGSYYYLDSGSGGSGPSVKVSGAAIAVGTQGAWNPIGAEQTAGGYEVAWKNGSADQYIVWATDSNGNLTSFLSGVVSGASTTLQNFEASFHQDLNGDGVISSTSAAPLSNAAAADLLQLVGNNSQANFNFASNGQVSEAARAGPADYLPEAGGAHPGSDAVAEISALFAPSSGAALLDAQNALAVDLHVYTTTQGFHLL